MSSIEDLPDDGAPDKADRGLRVLAQFLGLREDFLIKLIEEPDDWSFVVKTHAFLESVVCSLIALHLRRPELDEVLAEEVEMHARIVVTKALGITTSEDRKAMMELGKLRNRLVHNAKETSFTFAEHFGNNDRKANFIAAFGHGIPDPFGNPPIARAQFVEGNPRFALFQAIVRIAIYVFTEAQKIRTEAVLEGLRRATEGPAGTPG